jgi:hypothetical protein
MIYLVTYDLKAPGKDYSTLYNLLKSAPTWWHYLESTWLIRTNENVASWAQKIQGVVDANDLFLVVDISKKTSQGWLPAKAWEWIKNNDV